MSNAWLLLLLRDNNPRYYYNARAQRHNNIFDPVAPSTKSHFTSYRGAKVCRYVCHGLSRPSCLVSDGKILPG
jgi:hypothetical protein